MEAALVFGHIEKWQLADLRIGVVVDALRPDRPVAGTHGTVLVDLALASLQPHFEFVCRDGGEYLAQSVTDAVHLVCPQRVAIGEGASLEVHKYFVFRYRGGHQLSVATQDIAACGLYAYRVALQAVGHLRPVLFLGSHDV